MIRTTFGFGKLNAGGPALAVCREKISKRARWSGRKMDFITRLVCIFVTLCLINLICKLLPLIKLARRGQVALEHCDI